MNYVEIIKIYILMIQGRVGQVSNNKNCHKISKVFLKIKFLMNQKILSYYLIILKVIIHTIWLSIINLKYLKKIGQILLKKESFVK